MSESELIIIPTSLSEKKDGKNTGIKKDDLNTLFLRSARSGNLPKMMELVDLDVDINASNANGLNALHLASKENHVDVVSFVLKHGANVDATTKKGNTALHIASLAGNLKIVKMLIDSGANVNLQSHNGFTPLYMASQENHIEVVDWLLQKGANQSLATEDGFIPLAVSLQQGHQQVVALLLENDGGGSKMRLPALHIAAKKDDVRAAKLLLENNLNSDKTLKVKNLVNDITKSGFTPLHIAAHYGNSGVGRLLIDHGADVNFKARNLITPLHISSKWGRLTMVVMLLDCGAAVDPTTRDGLTPMHCAARSGHHQVVEALLKRGAKVELKTVNGLTPLHMAIQGDHEVCAKILLLNNSDINQTTVDYLTPLHVAAHCGNVKTAKLLLQDKKCQVNARALNGFTPLHIACKKNRIKVVELLLKYGAAIEATTESGLTPLHVASFMGHMNIVVHLIQHGSNPNTPTCRGETALHLASRANQTDIIRILLRNGAQVSSKSWDDQTTLHVASRLGNLDNLMLLLRHGANPDDLTKEHMTPLHLASKEGHLDVVTVLLDHAAKKEGQNKKGFTPLHLACKNNHLEIVELLLAKGCNPNVTSHSGLTPAHVATHYNNLKIVHLLLKNKADPTLQAKNGYTPLHIAAKKNRMEIASSLLEAGVPRNPEIHNGMTPLDLACQQGNEEMSQLLLEYSADPTHKAVNGVTAMHLVAQEDKVQVAPVLIKYKADVNAKTKAGYTPLHTACHFGQINMIRFLLQHGAHVNSTTKLGYTPLHHASQQGHIQAVDALLKYQADPNILNQAGQSPMFIASRLGYVSIVEILRPITKQDMSSAVDDLEKYKVILPDVIHNTATSDSEDETAGGVEDTMTMFIGKSYDQFPRGYDSLDSMALQQQQLMFNDTNNSKQQLINSINKQLESKLQQQIMETSNDSNLYVHEEMMYMKKNVQVRSDPMTWVCNNDEYDDSAEECAIHTSRSVWTSFLVSFMVDARGGLYKGCRHSGLKVIVPANHVIMPLRVMCRLVKCEKLNHPPPLCLGEALAGRVLELAPYGIKLSGPILLAAPYYASLQNSREIVVLRSDDGVHWRVHEITQDSDEKMDVLLNQMTELDISSNASFIRTKTNKGNSNKNNTSAVKSHNSPVSHAPIITSDIPKYFALVSRVKMEIVKASSNGFLISSKIIPQVQVVVPANALENECVVGLQTEDISPHTVVKLAGNRVAVAPIISIEPHHMQFKKAITVTTPLPTAAQKGMINQYGKDAASSLKLMMSLTDSNMKSYLNKSNMKLSKHAPTANWQDITATTALKIQENNASFNATLAARYWLVDCPKSSKDTITVTNEIFNDLIKVPFLARFLIYAKRVSMKEALLRVVACVDGEDFDGKSALENQEKFKEIARSKVVEVQDGKPMHIEMSGNLAPVTKSDEQLFITYKSSDDSKLTFFVRVKDTCQKATGTLALLPLLRNISNTIATPICCLSILLPGINGDDEEAMVDDAGGTKLSMVKEETEVESNEKEDERKSLFQRVSSVLQSDWIKLAECLNMTPHQIQTIRSNDEYVEDQTMAMLKLWFDRNEEGNNIEKLEEALKAIGRDDVLISLKQPVTKKKTSFVLDSNQQKDYLDKNYDALTEEIGSELASSRGSTLQRETMMDISYEHEEKMDEDQEPTSKDEKQNEEESEIMENKKHETDGKQNEEENEDESDIRLKHVINYTPENRNGFDSLGSGVFSREQIEETVERTENGKKIRRSTETTTNVFHHENGEEEVESKEVNERTVIMGVGVSDPYSDDDVIINVTTERSEQSFVDGSSINKKFTTIAVESKLINQETDETPITPTFVAQKIIDPPTNAKQKEGDLAENKRKFYDQLINWNNSENEVDLENNVPEDEVSVSEELLIKEECEKKEAHLILSQLVNDCYEVDLEMLGDQPTHHTLCPPTISVVGASPVAAYLSESDQEEKLEQDNDSKTTDEEKAVDDKLADKKSSKKGIFQNEFCSEMTGKPSIFENVEREVMNEYSNNEAGGTFDTSAD